MTKKTTSKNSRQVSTKGGVNKTLLFIFLALLIFGAIMIFDASVYKANTLFHDSFHFLKLHIFWVALGLIGGLIAYFINLKILKAISLPFLIIVIIGLVVVLVLGNDINGSKRWFELGGMTVQPAEFAKLAVVLFFATIFSKQEKSTSNESLNRKKFIMQISQFGIFAGIIVVLVMLEPDMGTTMIIALTSYSIFYFSGENSFHTKWSLIGGGVLGLLGTIFAISSKYRLARVQTYLHLLFNGEVDNPTGEGYQVQQILIGIGSSGFFGKGFGQSRQRFGYLVENTAFTDSIFAVVLEELGYASALLLVGLWLIILWQGLKTAINIDDKFIRLVAGGITIWLCSQTFLNMAANVGLIPLTGIPLPLFTYGGSNTLVTMVGIGILLNTTRYAKNESK